MPKHIWNFGTGDFGRKHTSGKLENCTRCQNPRQRKLETSESDHSTHHFPTLTRSFRIFRIVPESQVSVGQKNHAGSSSNGHLLGKPRKSPARDWRPALEKICAPPARPRRCRRTMSSGRITCYDLASRHSHRRRQQGPSEVRIAVKAEQLNQDNDPEGREVVQACNSRLITGERSRQSTTSHWCMKSEMTDLMLLTPFSCETRHSGFLQDLINIFPTPGMCTHSPAHPRSMKIWPTQKSSTGGSVSVKSRHEPVPLPKRPECQQARAPRNPPLPRLFFQAAGVTFLLPREGRRACLSVVCSLLPFSLLSFIRADFPGVV